MLHVSAAIIKTMLSRSLIPVVMFVLGALSVLAWQWTSRGHAPDEPVQTARTLKGWSTLAEAKGQPVEQDQGAAVASDASPPTEQPQPAAASASVSPERL